MSVFPKKHESGSLDRSKQRTSARAFALWALGGLVAVSVLGSDRQCSAQAVGPYGNDAGGYAGPLSYNPTYAQYGLPGVGVSPWNPIVQQQLNLGMRTARYQMYTGWANQSNAAANLFYQQALTQQQRNSQQATAVPPRYDVRDRIPRPVDSSTDKPKMLPKNAVLRGDGAVIWPANLPADDKLEPAKAAAETAIRVAVKEYEAGGKASVQSVAEAKSQLFAFGKPVLEQVSWNSRGAGRKLLDFFKSLEHTLDQLANE